MAHMHTPQGVDHYPCYTPSQIGTITEGSGSMEESVLCLSNTVLHAVAFQIIGMITQGKDEQL